MQALEAAGSSGMTKGSLDSRIQASDAEIRAALGQLLEDGNVQKTRMSRRGGQGLRRSHHVWRLRDLSRDEAPSLQEQPSRAYQLYVIQLREAARDKVVKSTPPDLRGLIDDSMPCIYVGYTGTTPEERFRKHKEGGLTSSKIVEEYGVKPLLELFGSLHPLPSVDEALTAEIRLARALRTDGYAVYGSHGERLRL